MIKVGQSCMEISDSKIIDIDADAAVEELLCEEGTLSFLLSCIYTDTLLLHLCTASRIMPVSRGRKRKAEHHEKDRVVKKHRDEKVQAKSVAVKGEEPIVDVVENVEKAPDTIVWSKEELRRLRDTVNFGKCKLLATNYYITRLSLCCVIMISLIYDYIGNPSDGNYWDNIASEMDSRSKYAWYVHDILWLIADM